MMLAALALPALASLGKIVVFLIMLSVLVVLHELGHFIVARLNHVRVNDFALGMGPTILCWTSPRTGTNYRLNLLPIGGYCAMQGEDGKTNEARQQREFRELPATGDDENFQAKAPWRRLAIVAAGPVANFITAFVFMVAIAVGFGTPVATPTVGVLQPNMPAQRAGLRPGDRIVAVDSHAISSGEDLVELIHRSAHKRLHLEVRRGAQTFGIDVTPVERTLAGQKVGLLGFAPRQEMHRAGFIEGVSQAAFTFWSVVTLQLGILSALVTTPAQTFSGLSGPVGIAAISGQYQDLGWGPYLFLAAQISISLGI
ncbi:MAG: site-2 protease family protein, partial [Candidatus Eremiobacteraeota bacterium]|nr:site-2 protease family protein [Candidatus Eremiobacteraeota bacterium]